MLCNCVMRGNFHGLDDLQRYHFLDPCSLKPGEMTRTVIVELVSLKADTQFIPPLKHVRFLAQFLAKPSDESSCGRHLWYFHISRHTGIRETERGSHRGANSGCSSNSNETFRPS